MSRFGFNRNCLIDLPLELLESIFASLCDVESRISLAMAVYPRLWHGHRVPGITRHTFAFLFRRPTALPSVPRTLFGQLPPELLIMMLEGLRLPERMSVVLADYHHFKVKGIAPALSPAMRDSLIYVYVKDKERLTVEAASSQQSQTQQPPWPPP